MSSSEVGAPTSADYVQRAPSLEFVASVIVELGEPLEIGATPTGSRRVIPIAGGTVRGPRLSGRIVPGGADWLLMLEDGTAVIDARYTLEVTDASGTAHLVSISTAGVRTGPPEVLAAIRRGESVDPGDYYFRFAATVSTASSEHAWLTRSVLVASATRLADHVAYDLYRLT